jgi:ribosome-associated heat shock protein Hsp15
MSDSEKLRIDIWLYCARLFKSRTQATNACRESKIMLNEKFADPGHAIHLGDKLKIRASGIYREYLVKEVADINLSKQEAKRMYEEITSPDTLEKFRMIDEANKSWRMNKSEGPRPTKKSRREMDKFRGK